MLPAIISLSRKRFCDLHFSEEWEVHGNTRAGIRKGRSLPAFEGMCAARKHPCTSAVAPPLRKYIRGPTRYNTRGTAFFTHTHIHTPPGYSRGTECRPPLCARPVCHISRSSTPNLPRRKRIPGGWGGRGGGGGRATEPARAPCPRSATPAAGANPLPPPAGEPRGCGRGTGGGHRGRREAGEGRKPRGRHLSGAAGRAWAAPGPEIRALRGGPGPARGEEGTERGGGAGGRPRRAGPQVGVGRGRRRSGRRASHLLTRMIWSRMGRMSWKLCWLTRL